MHPALIILPALGLILGPRIWAARVMKQYDGEGACETSAKEVARDLLDRNGLHAVAVEVTDLGDHYDPKAKVVRLSRRHFDSDSLTAVTTAAHEVAHAVQHATGYPPFMWRARLARVAQVTGEIGTVLVIALPPTFMLTRHRLPPTVIGGAALAMLGTSSVAQFAALPTELDASFQRALPMLHEGYVDDAQLEDAHRILYACSLTYVAASLAGVLHIWPWLGGVGAPLPPRPGAGLVSRPAREGRGSDRGTVGVPPGVNAHPRSVRGGAFEAGFRRLAKPLVRRWLQSAADAEDRARGVVGDAGGH